MPFKGTPICLKCEAKESPMWTNAENLGALCLNCVNEAKQNLKEEQEDEEDDNKQNKRKLRPTRSYKTRQNPFAVPKTPAPKGKGRRSLFKKTPMKAPTAVATTVSSDCIFYKGSYIQIGDIVSLQDEEGDTYYAQITGLLTDQYCEKSAVITWLFPTNESPKPNEGFDPATYIIGLEEDIPRSLDCMEFIMHAPSDYYKSKITPYPNIHAPARPGYIWTSLETIQRLCGVSDKDDINSDSDVEVVEPRTEQNSQDAVENQLTAEDSETEVAKNGENCDKLSAVRSTESTSEDDSEECKNEHVIGENILAELEDHVSKELVIEDLKNCITAESTSEECCESISLEEEVLRN